MRGETFPIFDQDSFVKDMSLYSEFLDNLLEQISCSKVERVQEDRVPTPHSDNDIGEPGQIGTG